MSAPLAVLIESDALIISSAYIIHPMYILFMTRPMPQSFGLTIIRLINTVNRTRDKMPPCLTRTHTCIQQKSNSTAYHSSATKVICEKLRSYPSRKEWTRPLRVLLAAQCPLQKSPISLSRVRHIHIYNTAVPVSYSA